MPSSTRSSSFRSRPCRHCRCFSIFLTPVEGTILILYTRSLSTLGNDTRSARKRAITRAETCHGFTLPSAHASFLFLSSFTSFVSELCGNSREFVRLRVDCFHLYLDSLLNLLRVIVMIGYTLIVLILLFVIGEYFFGLMNNSRL